MAVLWVFYTAFDFTALSIDLHKGDQSWKNNKDLEV